MRARIFAVVVTIIVLGIAAARSITPRQPGASTLGASTSTPAVRLLADAPSAIRDGYGKLPLSFEANQGQADPSVKFLARGAGYTVFLTASDAVIALKRSADADASVLAMKLRGANEDARLTPLERLPGNSNYFIGSDQSKWRTGVPNYARVHYDEVYRGVDLVYYGDGHQLEYDFVVEPGADARVIRFELEGADRIRVDERGDLAIDLASTSVSLLKPVAYQESRRAGSTTAPETVTQPAGPIGLAPRSDAREFVNARYVVNDDRHIRFEIDAYDPTRPLVIDPVLSYSTYLGGSGHEAGRGIAVDANGSAYVTGFTSSIAFPISSGAYDASFNGGAPISSTAAGGDVFVTKLNKSGTAVVYSTFIGGSDNDAGYAIAVDATGDAYIAGHTSSTNYPVASAFQPQWGNAPFGSNGDSFVTKLSSNGSALVYSTYLSGSSLTQAYGIAVDASGAAHVTGGTFIDFPTTSGPLVRQPASGSQDAFVAKLTPSGGGLSYARLLGGNGLDEGHAIALDSSGNAYVTGSAISTNFPTANPIQASNAGGQGDVFVTKLSASAVIVYSTYLGGDGQDRGNAIAVDSSGNAYVGGHVSSSTTTHFPTTNGAYQQTRKGLGDAFISKIAASGSSLTYSTLLSGTIGADVYGLAIDSGGNATVGGGTCSPDFPTSNAIQSTYGGFSGFLCDAIVTKLNATGSALVYSTYLGGSAGDEAYALALDSAGNAYVAGVTTSSSGSSSTPFPTANAIQGAHAGNRDAFVARVALLPPPTITSLGPAFGVTAGGTTVTITGANFQSGATVTIGGVAATGVTLVSATSLRAVTPAHAASTVDVIVDHPDFQSAISTSAFTFGAIMTLDRSALSFGATNTNGTLTNVTSSQPVTITFAESSSPTWSATTTASWLQITPGSGPGNGRFTVGIGSAAGLPPTGAVTASVLVTATSGGVVNSPLQITVRLTLLSSTTTTAPFGTFDTPAAGAGVQGSIAVTGWALDDIEVDRVEIWRDLVSGETTVPFSAPGHPGHGKVFIANTLFVQGARPDVEASYPTSPLTDRGGWGYLLLTWGLWDQGNSAVTLHAFAFDKEAKATTLGTKAVTASNRTATKPFGALDVPAYGQTMTGKFWNYGWSLTPKANTADSRNCAIADGNVSVSIDSAPLTPVTYGGARTDIAGYFPGFSNGSSAGGAHYVDTTTLSNGVHQIGWYVVDNCARADGIGSRFFTVLNGSSVTAADGGPPKGGHYVSGDQATDASVRSVRLQPDPVGSVRLQADPVGVGPVRVRQLNGDWTDVRPSEAGLHIVGVEQTGRIEVQLPAIEGAVYSGAQIVNGGTRALPLGSSLDAEKGIFYWQPAAGFLGNFELEFSNLSNLATTWNLVDVRNLATAPNLANASNVSVPSIRVRVVVGPSIRMAIDTPPAGVVAEQPVVLAGWAIDLAGTEGSGIDTVHVWAYPASGESIFLGVARVGDPRPDVAATYGAQFSASSYSLVAPPLASGTYDLVVYPHRAATGTFEGAQVVRVTVP